MDISKLNEIELKALAYDLIAQRDQITENLRVVNQELIARKNAIKSEDKEASS